MKSSDNTRHRFCIALVVSMLFCGLASIELPELVSLTDNTSNDFTLVVSAQSAPPVLSARTDGSVVPALSAIQEIRVPSEAPLRVAVPGVLAPSPSGYRLLLCISRT